MIAIVVLSALVAATGVALAARMHVHVPKGLAPARWFAAPVPVLLGVAVVCFASGMPAAAAPLVAAAIVCAAAAWTVAPTRRGNFARFEHEFWLHVASADREQRVHTGARR